MYLCKNPVCSVHVPQNLICNKKYNNNNKKKVLRNQKKNKENATDSLTVGELTIQSALLT